MKVKPLIATFHASEIEEVLSERRILKFDQVWLNYINSHGKSPPSYDAAREVFLDNPEYTHLFIAPHDLVVKNEHIEKLVKDIEENDYPVICGICNVDIEGQAENAAICLRDLPNPQWDDGSHKNHGALRYYNWAKLSDVLHTGIIKVAFAGFPLMAIRRDVVEEIPFETDYYYNEEAYENPDKGPASSDVMFNNRCFYKNIPIYVDTDVFMDHLRYQGKILVGKKNPSVELWKVLDTDGNTDKKIVWEKKLDEPRLVAAYIVRNEAQFIGRSLKSLSKIKDIDAVYIQDGSYMKEFHETSDSDDGTEAIARQYEDSFKEFYYSKTFGKFFESQSEKRNKLFKWIESYETDQDIYVLVIDGDEEIVINGDDDKIELKPLLKQENELCYLVESLPHHQPKVHPLENVQIRLFKARCGIHWRGPMEYVISSIDAGKFGDGYEEQIMNYSPNVWTLSKFVPLCTKFSIWNHWNERPSSRIAEKMAYLNKRALENGERWNEIKKETDTNR